MFTQEKTRNIEEGNGVKLVNKLLCSSDNLWSWRTQNFKLLFVKRLEYDYEHINGGPTWRTLLFGWCKFFLLGDVIENFSTIGLSKSLTRKKQKNNFFCWTQKEWGMQMKTGLILTFLRENRLAKAHKGIWNAIRLFQT